MNFYVLNWYVDIDGNQITSDEKQIKLESKVMALLVFLASHQGDVVSREQLEAAVWADQVTGYDALTTCLTRLRKALGDNSRQPQYIETVTKKGYRLIAPVHWDKVGKTHPVKNKGRVNWFIKKISILSVFVLLSVSILLYSLNKKTNNDQIALDKLPSIAVFQFENLSHVANQAYFSNGITADIRTALSKVSGLQVIATPSDQLQNNNPESLQDIHYSLSGSVQRAENTLRVNVRLIDNVTHHQLWAESYDREITEIFKVQDAITSQIVSTLSIKLTAEEKRRVSQKFTRSIEAYDFFLKGQSLYVQHTKMANLMARQYFQKAIETDPAFARAYGAQALTYVDAYRYHWDSDNENSLSIAITQAEKAVSIDKELPQSHWALAYARVNQHQYHLAIESANQSLTLNPNYTDALATLAESYIYSDNENKGVEILRKVMHLNPYYPAPYASILGQAYYFLGENEKALSSLQDAMEKNYSLLASHVMLIATLSRLGMKDEAEWASEQLEIIAPDFTLDDTARMFPLKDKNKQQNIIDNLRLAGIK
ncbi:MAG: winged helix-turn-helix domain-containing protein [gamma proteobacterium symbiont of Taylorina sp.]|nr:winged helix-turn-helix domain-containing protein [gamma proteobacterium symbiont of Taylorina sp.]